MATIVHKGTKLAYDDQGAGKPALRVFTRLDGQPVVFCPAGSALRPAALGRVRRPARAR